MTTISELQGLLTRVQQSVGDVEVKFKHAETEVYTEAKDILISLTLDPAASPSSVTITHGEPTSNAPETTPVSEPDVEPQGDVVATAQ
jgi:hypothetical protein